MKQILNPKLLLLFIFYLHAFASFGQANYVPTQENLQTRKWFQDAKFGLFIHWGVYSVLGNGEWVMYNKKIDRDTYKNLPDFFNPIDFNPKEWVQMAKKAGMKYITITSRHHDGFSMFRTEQSDWNIVDKTLFGKDVLKMLADECRKEEIKLFFYYSHLDWYRADYVSKEEEKKSPEKMKLWNEYLDFLNAQLRELLTNYGEIGGIWFDGWWDKPNSDWRLNETYSLIHTLQPQALIGNNHHRSPKPGEDFQMFEKDLPGKNTAGFSGMSEIGKLPLETCETMNRSWGYNIYDKNFKNSTELIHYLVKSAGYNSNFLLNVGPMPNGKIQQQNIDTLKVIGNWMEKYGETIYGTRGGPISPQSWGVTTQKQDKIYVHVLDRETNAILLPDFKQKIKSAFLFHNKKKVYYQFTKYGLILSMPEKDVIDMVIVLQL